MTSYLCLISHFIPIAQSTTGGQYSGVMDALTRYVSSFGGLHEFIDGIVVFLCLVFTLNRCSPQSATSKCSLVNIHKFLTATAMFDTFAYYELLRTAG